jgi:hypothetical protein
MARNKTTKDPLDIDRAAIERKIKQWKKVHLLAKDLLDESDDIRAILRTHMQLRGLTELATALGVISLCTMKNTDWPAALKSLGLTDAKIEELRVAFQKESEPFVRAPQEWAKERRAAKKAA